MRWRNWDRLSPKRCFSFFAVYSRFEFALKEHGYYSINRFGRAVPNWDKYAVDASHQFAIEEGSELDAAFRFLLSEPPMVQVGQREWSAIPLRGETDLARALDAAQRVRNNLFHGGKYLGHSSVERDTALIEAALLLLTELLKQDRALGEVFDG